MSHRTPESMLLQAVCEYLAHKGYTFWRTNNTGLYDPTNKRFRSFSKWGAKGVADIQVIIDGVSHFIELKTEKGVQSANQKEFEQKVKKAGAKYHLIRSLEDLQNAGF